MESQGCLTGMANVAPTFGVYLVNLRKHQMGKEKLGGMKFLGIPTLCRNMISFAIHAGGPVSRTGFPVKQHRHL